MSVPTSIPSPPRSTRPLVARKQPNDQAWFSSNTTPVTSVKRQAVERIEGEPRNKRKKVVEATLQTTSQLGRRVDKLQERQNDELPVVSVVLSCGAHEGSVSSPGAHKSRRITPICQQGATFRAVPYSFFFNDAESDHCPG